MTLGESMLPEFDQEMANTRKMLNLLPEDKLDWKPQEKSMTLGRLAGHIAEFPEWGLFTLKLEVLSLDGRQHGYIATSRTEALEKFDTQAAETRQLLASISDEEFHKTWRVTSGGKTFMEMPRIAVWRTMVMNHMIHHRAQFGVYLRLLNLPIPGMYGPSADEKSTFVS